MRPDGPRDKIVGLDGGPAPPFPLRMKGKVVSGFGRGSKELGIPTANIPVEGVPWIEDAKSGVYFGWAGIQLPSSHPSLPSKLSSLETTTPPSQSKQPHDLTITQSTLPKEHVSAGWVLYPMVMSIGYNPFYKNTVRSAEVHVLHHFSTDFYGSDMCISILGYIRPEYDYVSVESLIEDIREDCEVAKRSLDRPGWREGLKDPWLWGHGDGGELRNL